MVISSEQSAFRFAAILVTLLDGVLEMRVGQPAHPSPEVPALPRGRSTATSLYLPVMSDLPGQDFIPEVHALPSRRPAFLRASPPSLEDNLRSGIGASSVCHWRWGCNIPGPSRLDGPPHASCPGALRHLIGGRGRCRPECVKKATGALAHSTEALCGRVGQPCPTLPTVQRDLPQSGDVWVANLKPQCDFTVRWNSRTEARLGTEKSHQYKVVQLLNELTRTENTST